MMGLSIGILFRIILPSASACGKSFSVRFGSRSLFHVSAPEVTAFLRGGFLMRYEQYIVGIVTVLYFSVCAIYATRGNMPWALVWFSYAMANVGLIWAAAIK
jgi:hypothetical protein